MSKKELTHRNGSTSSVRKVNPLLVTNMHDFQKELLESLKRQKDKDIQQEEVSSSIDVEEVYKNMDKNYYKMDESNNIDSGDDINFQFNRLRGENVHRKKTGNLKEVINLLSSSVTGRGGNNGNNNNNPGSSSRYSLIRKYTMMKGQSAKKRFASSILSIRWVQRLRIRIMKYGSTERHPKTIVKNDVLLSSRMNTVNGGYKKKKSKCVIAADSKWIKFWNLFMFIVLIYYTVFYSYSLCFEDKDNYKLHFYDYIIEGMFLIDICFNFFKEFYNDDGASVYSLSIIALQNIKRFGFFIDIISIFPFYAVIHSHNAKFFGLIKLYRFFSPIEFPSFISAINNSFYSGIIKVFVFIFKTFVICHLFACLWYFIAYYNNFEPSTWVARNGYVDTKNFKVYLKSLYFSFSVFITVGYGDITPYTLTEIIIICIWLLFCGLYYSFNLSLLGGIFEKENMKSIKINNLMRSVKALSHKNKLSSELEDKIKDNIQKSIDQYSLSNVNNMQSIWNDLNSDLKYKVILDIYNGEILKLGLISECKKEFLLNLIPLLEPRLYAKDSYVYKTKMSSEFMYFILKGTISFMTEDEIPFSTISKWNYFGEIEIIKKTYREMAAKNKENSQLLLLNKKDLYNDMILNDNHFLFNLIGRMMKRYIRYIKNRKTIISIINYGKSEIIKQKNKSILLNTNNLKESIYNYGINELLNGKHSNVISKEINYEHIKELLNAVKSDDKNDFEISYTEEEKEVINKNVTHMKENIMTGSARNINFEWFGNSKKIIEKKSNLKIKSKNFTFFSIENNSERKEISNAIDTIEQENIILKRKIEQFLYRNKETGPLEHTVSSFDI